MSRHTFTDCWIHLVWATANRRPLLGEEAARRTSRFLMAYAEEKGIYMRINFVNPDHTHALIELPSHMAVEQAAKYLKGASSHWINKERIVEQQFNWQRGFGAFSVSHDRIPNVAGYIAHQPEHHKKRDAIDEFRQMLAACEAEWEADESESVEEEEAEYQFHDEEIVQAICARQRFELD